MNLWLLTGEYPPDYGGGIATYSYHTAQMLSQRGHHVTVFAADEKSTGGCQVQESVNRLRVVRFGANQSPQSEALGEFARWSYDASLVLSEFCRKEGAPDVLEAQEYLGIPYFTLQRRLLMDEALAKIPVLVTAHTPLYLCHLYDLLPAHRFPGYWIGEMERFSLLAADEVVIPSNYLRNEIEKDLPQIGEHTRVIANPYQDDDDLGGETISSGRRGFLFMAKIERRKGIEPLLLTFRQMWNAGLDEPLFLVGDDWFDDIKQTWMSETIQQHYGKFIEEKLLYWEGKQPLQIVKQRLGKVRAMIMPSLLENYPYAVLESMAAGCPVVVSQSGGHAEMVEPGISGFIFSHLESGDLRNKIQAVLHLTQNEHDRMSAAAQARARQISGYDTVAPIKEEALEWARERAREQARTRTHFPFLRSIPRGEQPPEEYLTPGEGGLLSVVIPFYNLGDYVEDTLKSFDNLQGVRFEIIVVDDGSNDQASLEKLNTLQARYKFHLERTKNRGLAIARNTGACLAHGEFLTFLDADDCMEPLFYQQALKVLQVYENVSFVGCWVEYFGDTRGYWPTWTPELPYALVHNPINTGALVYRKADFLRYGLNDPAFAYVMEDYDSMLCMLENGCRGVALPEPYHKYRVRQSSMFHTTTETSKVWIYQQLVEKHRKLYTVYAEDILGLTNANGPGYLFDNPTLCYPSVGYHVEPGLSRNGQLNEAEISQVPAATLLYYAFRSTFFKPYTQLSGKLPWLKKVAQMLKDKLGQ